MAVVTEVTVSTASRVELGGQERTVGLALTYRLEPGDGDVRRLVREKAAEVERMHKAAWKGVRDETLAAASGASESAPPADAQVLEDAQMRDEELAPAKPAAETQIKAIDALVRASPLGEDEFEVLLQERFGCSRSSELSRPQAGSLLVELQRNERERLARQKTKVGSRDSIVN